MDDLISRQAAIEKLRSNLAYMRAFGVSRSLLLLNELPSAQPEPQWIPCSEKLPEKAGEYIVTDDSGGLKCINISHFYPDAAPVNGDDMRWDYINVTAWMPLPKPYKGE